MNKSLQTQFLTLEQIKEKAQSLGFIRHNRSHQKYLKYTRPDGLTVFIDQDNDNNPLSQLLNSARLYADKKDVILLVGAVRGFQIACSYADQENVDLKDMMKKTIRNYKKLLDKISTENENVKGKKNEKRN